MLEALCTLLFVSGNFLQRAHNEVPLLHTGVGEGKFRGVHGDVVVGEEVYVDGAVGVQELAVGAEGFLRASEFLLYLLRFAQAGHGGHHGVHEAYEVYELVGAGEPHGVGFHGGGDSVDRAHALIDECEGSAYVLFPVAEVGTEGKVEFVCHLRCAVSR